MSYNTVTLLQYIYMDILLRAGWGGKGEGESRGGRFAFYMINKLLYVIR